VENEVIVKKSLRANSSKETILRCIGLSAMFVGFVLGILGFFLLFEEDVFLELLLLAIFLGGFLCYHVVGIARGRVHAIISDEGIAIRALSFEVIPWEDIHGIDPRWGRNNSTLKICIRFVVDGDTHEVPFNVPYFANYNFDEVIEITDGFWDRHRLGSGHKFAGQCKTAKRHLQKTRQGRKTHE